MKINPAFYTSNDSWTDDRNPLTGNSMFHLLNYEIHQSKEYAAIFLNAPSSTKFLSLVSGKHLFHLVMMQLGSSVYNTDKKDSLYED